MYIYVYIYILYIHGIYIYNLYNYIDRYRFGNMSLSLQIIN